MGAGREGTELEKIYNNLLLHVRSLDKMLWSHQGKPGQKNPLNYLNECVEDVDRCWISFRNRFEELKKEEDRAQYADVEGKDCDTCNKAGTSLCPPCGHDRKDWTPYPERREL